MIPKMPDEYKGSSPKGEGGGHLTKSRSWTPEETEWVKRLISEGYSYGDIAKSVDRSEISVNIKVKRLSKKDNTYNAAHVVEKYELNDKFLEMLKPRTVLDLYCGEKNFYKDYKVTTNDINADIPADYHMDALKCICKLYSEGNKYDLVDLDPFGSAYECFDLAVKMAKKGLVITLGELGHKRWRRFDYVRPHYGISTVDEFSIDKIISEIQRIGLMNKKKLVVWQYREWKNIGRVWFTIENSKVTEQWHQQGDN